MNHKPTSKKLLGRRLTSNRPKDKIYSLSLLVMVSPDEPITIIPFLREVKEDQQ